MDLVLVPCGILQTSNDFHSENDDDLSDICGRAPDMKHIVQGEYWTL